MQSHVSLSEGDKGDTHTQRRKQYGDGTEKDLKVLVF